MAQRQGDGRRIESRQVPARAPAASRGRTARGSGPASVRPSRSRIWLAKMITAMPAVKPTVTGEGGKRGCRCRAAGNPAAASGSPTGGWGQEPARPCRGPWTGAATSTMKAPAGPPTWRAAAAQRRYDEAPDDGRIEPRALAWRRRQWRAPWKAGRATMATVRPAMASAPGARGGSLRAGP